MGWLAERLLQKEPLILPGAYDGVSAKLMQFAGIEACYCSGFSTCASAYGLPDLGLLGLEDMCNHYRRIKGAVNIPLIVDGDTGYGGLLNVQRTVQQLVSIGVVACHIEDQVFPKRCGHMAGKEVVSQSEAEARIKAAVNAVCHNDFDIIARTDAIAVNGFDDAIERANRYLQAGACAVFIDAPQSLAQIKAIPSLVDGPVLYNAAPIGPLQAITGYELLEYGYKIVIHPIELLMAAVSAVRFTLDDLKANYGRVAPSYPSSLDFGQLNDLLGAESYLQREEAYFITDD